MALLDELKKFFALKGETLSKSEIFQVVAEASGVVPNKAPSLNLGAPVDAKVYFGGAGTYTLNGSQQVVSDNLNMFFWDKVSWKVLEVPIDMVEYLGKENVQLSGMSYTAGVAQTDKAMFFPSIGWTIQLFFTPTDVNSVQTIFMAGTGAPLLLFNSGKIVMSKLDVISTLEFNAASFLNKPTFLTITYDGSNYGVFVNGEVYPFTVLANDGYGSPVDKLTIGSYLGDQLYFKGDIHLVRIYNRTLDGAEVKSHFNDGLPLLRKVAKEPHLKIELHGDNTSKNKWRDSGPNGYDASVTGDVVSFSNSPEQSSGGSVDGINFLDVLPPTFNVAQGREFNLWFDSIIPHYGKEFRINVNCSKGQSRERSFRYTSETIEALPMTVQIKDLSNRIIESKTVMLECLSKGKGTGTKQILFIGDSNIDSFNPSDYPGVPEGRERYEMMKEINALFIADGGFTPKFLGNRGMAPYHHQAHSGYTTDLFITNNPTYPNPFWDGAKVNFRNYMAANSNFGGADRIDVGVIQLSINDFRYGGSVATVLNNIKTLVSKIQDPVTGYPSCKVLVSMSPYTAATRDGWALHFNAISDYDGFVNRMLELDKLLIKEENPANLFFVCPTMMWVDRLYGYPRKLTKVSDRGNEEVFEYTDSVHPSSSGYKQAADALYSRLRGIL